MKKSIIVVFLIAAMATGSSLGVANAGPWCDAAREQQIKPPSGNPAVGNPYKSGEAGANWGSFFAQVIFCAFDL